MEIVLGPLLCFIGQSVPSCPQMGCVGILGLPKGSSIMYIHVFCWALPLLLFVLLLCWMAKRISGWGICVSPFVWLFLCLFFVVDLPCYMTTGVNVDFISNCFFTCKDRALERDRPYLRKKIMYIHVSFFRVYLFLFCLCDTKDTKVHESRLLVPDLVGSRAGSGSGQASSPRCTAA